MERQKVNRKLKICKLCGVDVGKDPGRHMKRYHNGERFQKLKDGDPDRIPIKKKNKGGGYRYVGHGF